MKALSIFAFLLLFSFAAKAEEERGKCVGSERAGLESRIKNESFCLPFSDKQGDCVKNKDKCDWVPEKKACTGKDDENEKQMKACGIILMPGECLQNSDCKWDYKRRGCNAKDPSSQSDADQCENFDGSEAACNSNKKCIWGIF